MNIFPFRKKTARGQSLLELGLVLPIILLILVGVVELGMILFQWIAMRDAAQEGAVYISIYPTACNQAIERTKADLYNVKPEDVTVTVLVNGTSCIDTPPALACAPHDARVTVSQPNYPITMPLLGSILGRQTISLSATMTSTIIRPPCP